MKTMNRLKVVAFAALIAAVASVHATPVENGIGFNGIGFNGIGFNGIGFNGIGFNGIGFNGIGFNGIGFNGIGFNGSRVIVPFEVQQLASQPLL